MTWNNAQEQADTGIAQAAESAIARWMGFLGLARRDRARVTEIEIANLEQQVGELRDQLKQVGRREADARYLASHDGLTGLANRSLLMDRYVQAAAHAQRSKQQVAVLIFDIDGFKQINDSLGHLAGDRLLQRIGKVIESMAVDGDTACRYGGDEFVLLLGNVDSLENARLAARKVHRQVVDTLREDGIQSDVTASCGIAMYPMDGNNWHDLLHSADQEMYRRKHRGELKRPQRPERNHARDYATAKFDSTIASSSAPMREGHPTR